MDLSLRSGERQVADKIEDIRRDHVARYEWAAVRLRDQDLAHVFRFVDVGCGIGYGANILASRLERRVWALDHSSESIEFGRQHFRHRMVFWEPSDWTWLSGRDDGEFHTATCFEMIEHVADPLPMLKAVRHAARRLIASVPNEDVLPFIGYKFHHRHYTKAEFEALLNGAGWHVTEWWGQAGPESDVERDCNGRTLIAVCERANGLADKARPMLEEIVSEAFADVVPDPQEVFGTAEKRAASPQHIAIVAFGPTSAFYLDAAKKEGNRKRFADFVIGINAMGSVIDCDLVFHMDDIRIQERRAAAEPEGHVAGIVEWLREYRGRVITSRAHPDYPHMEEFPLEDVLNKFGGGYFNGTGAAALAYAIYLEPKEISLWGFDFTYPNAHKSEKGRACVEYWLGRAQERDIAIRLPPKTSLMDSYEDSASDEAHIYGYDTIKLNIAFNPETERFEVTKTPRPESEWPTAEEVEAAYDHGKHPADQGRKRA